MEKLSKRGRTLVFFPSWGCRQSTPAGGVLTCPNRLRNNIWRADKVPAAPCWRLFIFGHVVGANGTTAQDGLKKIPFIRRNSPATLWKSCTSKGPPSDHRLTPFWPCHYPAMTTHHIRRKKQIWLLAHVALYPAARTSRERNIIAVANSLHRNLIEKHTHTAVQQMDYTI